MDEFIELLDSNGKPTGKRCLKSNAHKFGYYHATVHVWFYTKDKQLLLQKRHDSKTIFPSLWDTSVAGHISYKELPIAAAQREILEEIGIRIQKKELINIGTSTHKHIHNKKLIDYERHHIYICMLNHEINNLEIQESEVAAIKLIAIDAYKLELRNNPEKYVPHGDTYYDSIFNAIKHQTKKA
jgi:isopentenyl-diphosphate delta-isomerase